MARAMEMTSGGDPDPGLTAVPAVDEGIDPGVHSGTGPGTNAVPGTKGESDTKGVPAAVLVGAIALLVVLVSLPRFRAHVLRANQSDARLTLDLLSQTVFAEGWIKGFAPAAAPEELFDVVLSEKRLVHRFQDARRIEGAPQMLHHGYLVDTGHVVVGALRRPALVSWPNTYGRSGDAAFARTRDGAMYAHRNGGLWSGPSHPLIHADMSDEGWQLIRKPKPTAEAPE